MPSSPSSAACVEEQSTPYSVQGIGSLGLDRAPSGGFSYRVAGKNKIFVFALVTDPSNPNPGLPASVLASKENPAQAGAYTKEFTFSFLKFWSVVPIVVDNAEHPGLPLAACARVCGWGRGKHSVTK
jgi:hypothetical protein